MEALAGGPGGACEVGVAGDQSGVTNLSLNTFQCSVILMCNTYNWMKFLCLHMSNHTMVYVSVCSLEVSEVHCVHVNRKVRERESPLSKFCVSLQSFI